MKILFYIINSHILVSLLLTILFTGVYGIVASFFWNKRNWGLVQFIIATLSILFIVYHTLIGRTMGQRRLEWIPFSFFRRGTVDSAVMNIILFVPLGLSLPYCFPTKFKCKVLRSIISAFVFSLIIEIVQYKFAIGFAETDDVIMNTLGTVIGTGAYVFCESGVGNRALERIKKLLDKRKI